MKKISTKIFTITASCSCAVILLLGGISIFNSMRINTDNSKQLLVWMARAYAAQFSNEFSLIEEDVRSMETHLRNSIDIKRLKSDKTYLAEYEKELDSYMYNSAKHNTVSMDAWCYFNPELSDAPHDIYYIDEDSDGIPDRQPHIPFEYYDNKPTPTDDKQWWYGPVNTGKPLWTNPYEWKLGNGKIITAVSYARPVFIDDVLVAVVGTYYNFDEMQTEIANISVFESGYATLYNEKLDAIIHPIYKTGTRFNSDNLFTLNDAQYQNIAEQINNTKYGNANFIENGKQCLFAYAKLSNGWMLGVNPPLDEIYAGVNRLILQLMMAALVCLVLSLIAAWFMSRYVSKPLLAVMNGIRKISDGNLDIYIDTHTKDEIQAVAQSINKMVSSSRSLQDKLYHLAYYDDLTGGFNAHKFKQIVTEQLFDRRDKSYYLIRTDIDEFKLINDMFGFELGDEVLRQVYKTMLRTLPKGSVLSHVSNDDFIMLISVQNDRDVLQFEKRFYEEFKNMHKDMGRAYNLKFTTGVYKVQNTGESVDTMLDKVAMAHKAAKNAESDVACVFYNEHIRDSALFTRKIEDSMQKALENGEFVIYLQPKFDLKTEQMKGAEALVRWILPESGTVRPPSDFIPLFEKNGFVANIDLLVLQEVCKLQRKRLDEAIAPIPISVNQSKVLIFSADYVERVCEIADKYNVPHNLIELEILETLIHDNIKALKEIITRLKSLGFLISIDDFGSGYSSLNLLKDVKADVLKIDREFLNATEDDERGEIVLSNIIRLAKDLKMSVVTEGVETQKQAAMLCRLNCDTAQGYLYARPMNVTDFEGMNSFTPTDKCVK